MVNAITEPSAVAPDATLNFRIQRHRLGSLPELSVASGAAALGSVLTVSLLKSSKIHSVLLLDINLNHSWKLPSLVFTNLFQPVHLTSS